MNLDVVLLDSFKKDIKTIQKRGYDLKLLNDVIVTLQTNQKLPAKHRDHALTGKYKGFRECHIAPDWLLVYTVIQNELVLVLSRTGSHSDLF